MNKMHTYVVTFEERYLDDGKMIDNLRQAKIGCWCYSRLFGTCHLFYTRMDINEMTEFLKKTVGDTRAGYIFHETHGETYRYTITAGNQLKALQHFIDGKAKIDNKIFKLEQKQKVIEQKKEAAKKETQELDKIFEKSELAELIT
jgi:hypothetical protein